MREDVPGLEAMFLARYAGVARGIARIIRDPARAEELAVEVLLKWSRHPEAHNGSAEAWLHRAASRAGLDELRRQARRGRYERLARWFRAAATPEEVRAANEEREHVRTVLAALRTRDAELLLLRAQGLSYAETAAAQNLPQSSVGSLLSRAQRAFRKEYEKRYGER